MPVDVKRVLSLLCPLTIMQSPKIKLDLKIAQNSTSCTHCVESIVHGIN